MSSYFDPGNHQDFIMIDGNIVERKAHAIVQKIKEYDEDLDVFCIDPSHPDVTFADAPFVIVRRTPNGTYERVFEAWELDDRIIERLWLSDGQKNNQLDILVKMEEKKKREEEYAKSQKMGANHELFASAMATPKSSFSFRNEAGELVTIKDDEGVSYNNDRKSFS